MWASVQSRPTKVCAFREFIASYSRLESSDACYAAAASFRFMRINHTMREDTRSYLDLAKQVQDIYYLILSDGYMPACQQLHTV